MLTDNWKAHFLVFFGLSCFSYFFAFLFGPPHLALNPPSNFFLCFSLFFNRKSSVFPPKKVNFVYFWVSSFVSPEPFLASPFFTFSFSVSLFFFSFFLPSLSFFLLSFGSLFLSLSFCFFFAIVSWKEQHQNIQLHFSSILSLFLVSSLLFSFKSPFVIFVFFLILSYVFVQHQWCSFKNALWKTPIMGQEGGCNITFFLFNTNVKS